MSFEPADALDAAKPLMDVLVHLGVPHYIGGSLASSMHGNPRSTMDADLVADLYEEHVAPLCEAIEPVYIFDPETIKHEVFARESFNVIHREKLMKVDVFVLRHYKYERQVIDRIQNLPSDPAQPDELLPFCSVEDIILNKLMWFDNGGRQSQRQWSDLLIVIRVQGEALDNTYLEHWAKYLDIAGLLRDVIDEARELDNRS